MSVRDPVENAVHAGVDVGQEDDVGVDVTAEAVMPVVQNDDYVRHPTNGEDEKDDEEGADELQIILSLLWKVDVLLLCVPDFARASSDEQIDPQITDSDDDERRDDTPDGKEQRVAVVGQSVVDTTQCLPVIHMVSPAEEVRHLAEETDDPETNGYKHGVSECEDFRVDLVMADVDVPIYTDGADAEKRTEAASETNARHELAQSRLVFKVYLSKNETWWKKK